jgi:hypothetical protein
MTVANKIKRHYAICRPVLYGLFISPFAAYLRAARAIRSAQVVLAYPQPVDVLLSVAMGPGRGKKKNPNSKLSEGTGKAPRQKQHRNRLYW